MSVSNAEAGDIAIVTGVEDVGIGVTIADLENPIGLPIIPVDEPTLNMDFMVNTSPLAGKEGKFVTSRQIRERLTKELLVNVALRVEDTEDADVSLVDSWQKRYKRIKISSKIDASALEVISEENQPHIYRIIQEALTNIAKHSKAKKISIHIAVPSFGIDHNYHASSIEDSYQIQWIKE